jgi:hypothetical protein
MAQLQRLDITNRAKLRVGRESQTIDLVDAYDGITALMSTKYPLIAHQRATASCVSGQNYLAHSALTPKSATYPLANVSVSTRQTLINEAKKRAGVRGEGIILTTEYDMVTKDITGRHDILRGNYTTTNYTNSATDNWLSFPTGLKHVDHMKSDATTRVEVVGYDSELFWGYAPSFGAGYIPVKYHQNNPESKIYLNPFPSSAGPVAYYLWYTKYHPVATSDTYQHILGEEFDETIIQGLAAYASESIGNYRKAKYFRMMFEEDLAIKAEFMRTRRERFLYGTTEIEWLDPELFWAFYTAVNGTPTKWTWTWIDGVAGTAKFWMYPPPDATTTATVVYSCGNPKSTGNTYTHLMGEELDEAAIRGVCWKACEIIQDYEKALYWKSLFDFELASKAEERTKWIVESHQAQKPQPGVA